MGQVHETNLFEVRFSPFTTLVENPFVVGSFSSHFVAGLRVRRPGSVRERQVVEKALHPASLWPAEPGQPSRVPRAEGPVPRHSRATAAACFAACGGRRGNTFLV